MSPDYLSALSYFNELMNHLPSTANRYSVKLQKNASPSVNLKRLCFSLDKRPETNILKNPQPCALKDLRLPHDSRPASFVEGAKEEIDKPHFQAPSLIGRDIDETAFYFEQVFVLGIFLLHRVTVIYISFESFMEHKKVYCVALNNQII